MTILIIVFLKFSKKRELDFINFQLYSPHSHPDSPHSHPDSPHSVPRFPILAFTDSLKTVLDITVIISLRYKETNLTFLFTLLLQKSS